MADMQLHQGDCLEILPMLAAQSVDAIICDLPYGTTSCKWDEVIPFVPMWEQVKRIAKPGAAIVLFCTQPFTTMLIGSNIKRFKYCWTWDKKTAKGHLVAKIRPMQQTEDIAVFGWGKINYFPVKSPRPRSREAKEYRRTEIMGGQVSAGHEHTTDFWYPKTLLCFPWSPAKRFHPTEKPVSLLKYLVHTYTREGEIVLDFAMGSGSTGVAALQTGRHFVGIEKDSVYFNLAQTRMREVAAL